MVRYEFCAHPVFSFEKFPILEPRSAHEALRFRHERALPPQPREKQEKTFTATSTNLAPSRNIFFSPPVFLCWIFWRG